MSRNAAHRSPVRALVARVVSHVRVCREHGRLEVVADRIPAAEPGQFYQVRCGEALDAPPRVVELRGGVRPLVSPASVGLKRPALLRRPLSIADQWRDADGRDHLAFIYRVVGIGTSWLRDVTVGQWLDLIGPLGRGFALPEQDVPLACVGGGVGIPPLLFVGRRLGASGRRGGTFILGATTRALLPVPLAAEPDPGGEPRTCLRLPGEADMPAIITSDDGSVGMRGVVTDGLARWIDGLAPQDRDRALVLACGPEAMLAAVARYTREAHVSCQLSIERRMACGLGTCLSCIVRVRDAARPGGVRWALACSEGPVFDRDELATPE